MAGLTIAAASLPAPSIVIRVKKFGGSFYDGGFGVPTGPPFPLATGAGPRLTGRVGEDIQLRIPGATLGALP